MPASHHERPSMPSGDSVRHDEVLDHWQSELAEAERAERDGGQRPWLARMRVRLYRFLLACYASGPWGARPQGAEGVGMDADSAGELPATCQAPYISLAGWTHVRPPGKIAAVLKAVAGAQEPHAAGPLVHGLESDSWVTLATESSHVDLERFVRILKHNGIEQRIRTCGEDRVLEVRASDRVNAAYWLGHSVAELRTMFHRERGGVLRITEILFLGFVLGLGGIPLVA